MSTEDAVSTSEMWRRRSTTMALVIWTLSTSRPSAFSGIARQVGRGCRRTWRTACSRAIKAPIGAPESLEWLPESLVLLKGAVDDTHGCLPGDDHDRRG